jgi:hypothetical protein
MSYVDPMNELNAMKREQRLNAPSIEKKKDKDDDKMSRRDYFAAAALTGIIAAGPSVETRANLDFCVLVADALIAKLDEEVKK